MGEFLEFLVSRYDDIMTPFKKLSGGDGAINIKEFKVGLEKMKCHKFIDPTIKDKALQASKEDQRIANVFRYLDPSGEGEVSEGEWGILMNLWKEMRQSIREFVQFLERTFSRKDKKASNSPDEEDALDAAWDFIDDDGS